MCCDVLNLFGCVLYGVRTPHRNSLAEHKTIQNMSQLVGRLAAIQTIQLALNDLERAALVLLTEGEKARALLSLTAVQE